MNKPWQKAILILLAATTASIAACTDKHLLGEGSDAGSLSGGAGTAGMAGPGGGSGATGTGGTASTAPRSSTLLISPRTALLRMTNLLWGTPPDDALVAEVVDSTFANNVDLVPIARRVVQDPRAETGLRAFYRWWMRLDRMASTPKDLTLFPSFTDEMRASMVAETETFGAKVTLNEDGFLSTLLLAPYSYLDERLAAHYGVPGVSGGDLRKVSLDPTRRAGILTHGSIMSINARTVLTSPTLRGVHIVGQLQCREVTPPPAAVQVPMPAPAPQTTTRQTLEAITKGIPVCITCHDPLDTPGFAFEGLDAVGRARDLDNGAPVNTRGTLASGQSFNGPGELAELLAGDPAVQGCYVKKWFEYALGRSLSPDDDASVADATRVFHAASHRMREAIIAVLTSSAFLAP